MISSLFISDESVMVSDVWWISDLGWPRWADWSICRTVHPSAISWCGCRCSICIVDRVKSAYILEDMVFWRITLPGTFFSDLRGPSIVVSWFSFTHAATVELRSVLRFCVTITCTWNTAGKIMFIKALSVNCHCTLTLNLRLYSAYHNYMDSRFSRFVKNP